MLLSNTPASPGAQRFASGVVVVSALLFVALAPFAKIAFAPMPSFIPTYQSAMIITDLITVVFLFEQSRLEEPNALTLLAGGYLFTALMAALHALTYPGLFAAGGLLGAGPQTTAWMYMFWHGGFPLFVIGYACTHGAASGSNRSERLGGVAIAARALVVVALVLGFTLIATMDQKALPPIMQGDRHLPAILVVVDMVWLLNLAALLLLACRYPHSTLDLWLMVAMGAWLFDIALSAGLDDARYDLGFYAGRIYGLLAASLVLIVLLMENGRLYVHMIRLREGDREQAAALYRLSATDPLTGIANRRAFEEALDLEWRRMMRHGSPLSLLMIDVDYFKRFNDTYGHVAGDQCLRQVAAAVAGRARRAGEVAARYGGEEFAVLLPHTEIAAARQLAERICAAVRAEAIPHAGSAVAPHVTISVGAACIAEVPELAAALSRGESAAAMPAAATALVQAADAALYQAKLAGRNRVVAGCREEGAVAAALPIETPLIERPLSPAA